MKRRLIAYSIFVLALLFYTLAVHPQTCPIDGPYFKTSAIGMRRDPTVASGGEVGFHRGTDYAAEAGTAVRSCFAGIVIEHWPAPNGYYKGHPELGGMIRIQDNDGVTTYAHMGRTFVKEGQIIEEGQLIGVVGSTGKSTGPHLHLERLIELRF